MKVFDMPKEPEYELEVLDRSYDSHDSDEVNAKSDVWVWCVMEYDNDLERLKEIQKSFSDDGYNTRIIKVTRKII